MKKIKIVLLLAMLSIVSMLIGAVAYSSWIAGYKDLTEQLIYNSYTTHDTQNKLIQNYSISYDLLAECFQQDKCNVEQSLSQMQSILDKRQQLREELANLSKKTEHILTEMSKY